MKKIYSLLAIFFIFCFVLNAQTYQWAGSIGSGASDFGRNIATDATGNVYIAGYYNGTADFDPGPGIFNMTSAGVSDIFFAKYNSTGVFVWAKTIGGSGIDECYKIIVDASANVYIAGAYTGTVDFDPNGGITNLTNGGNLDGFFAKYTSAGNIVWAKKIGGTSDDRVESIAVDNAGVVYITGYFSGTVDFDPGPGTQNLVGAGLADDAFIGKYDASGNYTWANRLGGTSYETGWDIVIDGTGNCYVTGYFALTVDFDPGAGTANLSSAGTYDIYLAAYSTTGAYIWADRFGGTSNDGQNNRTCVDIDASGTLYLAGEFSGTADFDPSASTANLISAGTEDIFLAAYDNGGNYIYAKRIGGTQDDHCNDIDVEPNGDTYITGTFISPTVDFDPGPSTVNLTNSSGSNDMYAGKYDAFGNYIWAFKISSTGSDVGYGIYGDGTSCYITGIFDGAPDFDPGSGAATLTSGGGFDIYVAKYNNPQPLSATTTQTNPLCNGQCTGTATAVPAGGTGPYTYSWSNSQTTATATGLCAGSYTATVTDALSATSSVTVTITQPTLLTLSTSNVINATCFGSCNGSVTLTASGGTSGYTYSPSPNNLCAGTYTFTVTDVNGCTATQTAAITQPTLLTLSTSNVTNATCFGSCDGSVTLTASGGTSVYTYSPSPNNLCAGTHTFTVTDANGCTATQTVAIIQPIQLVASSSATPPGYCSGNCSQLLCNATGGTPSYTYLWSNGNTTPTTNVCPTVTTTYTCTITDANGCAQTTTVTVTVNPLPSVSFTQTPTLTCINWNPIVLSPGSPSGGAYSGPGVTGNQFDPVAATVGTWNVVYTYTDGNGCADSVTQQITVDLCTGINQNAIGDGIIVYPNPSSGIITVSGVKNSSVIIYNTLGEIMFVQTIPADKMTIDIASFSNSVYFLQVKSINGITTKKIIKEN